MDVSPWVETKLASLACHRTQISDDGPFSQLPEDVVHTLMGTEFYQLVMPTGASGFAGWAMMLTAPMARVMQNAGGHHDSKA